MWIRLALGASSWQVARLIVGQGIRLAAMGALIGVVGSLLVDWSLRARLYETPPSDPVTIIAAAALLLVTAAAACAAPARRVMSSSVRNLEWWRTST